MTTTKTQQPQQLKTLESLTSALQRQGITQQREMEETLHTASMLAFVAATHAVLHQSTMPTPMGRLKYNERTQTVTYTALQGRAPVPVDDALDINMLDFVLASMKKERMPLLLEGKTGVGKTYTVEHLFRTILSPKNYRMLRLNNNMSNVLQPYVEGTVENGLVKIKLKEDELDVIALLFVDEVNRGDANQVLMLQDGYVRLASGEGGEVGVPLPQYVNGKWITDRTNKRPLFVVSAQNPPATKDAKYAATKRTDAAQNNRNLQLDVPNGAPTIGASVLMLRNGKAQHQEFLELYQRTLAEYLNIPVETLATLPEEWVSVFAFATDPQRNVCPSITSAVEFLDGLILLSSPSLKDEFTFDQQVVKDWNDALRGYGTDFSYTSAVDETTAAMQKIRAIVTSFEEELITRDIVKAKKLADAVSLTRRIKEALKQDNPVQAYRRKANYITVQDIACGFAILLNDKQDKHDVDPIVLIDTALQEYTEICSSFAEKVGYKQPFVADDANMSVYNLAFQHALQQSMKATTLAGKVRNALAQTATPHVASFIRDLGASVAELKRLEMGKDYRKPLLGRMIADLTTLAGFAHQYGGALEPLLAGQKDESKLHQNFIEFYQQQRLTATLPDIYLQRLTRVLGV